MAEPKFVAKPGQVDFTDIRYCPVVNCVVTYKDKILLVERSPELRLYPGLWNGISGFLDDEQSVEDKAKEELLEEIFIDESQIVSMKRGKVLIQESEQYHKTWIVFPVLVEVSTSDFTVDWEAKQGKWYSRDELATLKLTPGFDEVLAEFFKKQ